MILYVVYGSNDKLRNVVADTLAFLSIECNSVNWDNCIDYLESGMMNKATNLVISSARYENWQIKRLESLAEQYQYTCIGIEVKEVSE